MKTEFNYSKLRGKIKEIFGSEGNFAKAMGFSRATLSAKLNNTVDFSQSEIDKACSLLLIDSNSIDKYFFTQKVK